MFLTIFVISAIMRYPKKSELSIGDKVEIAIYAQGKSKISQGIITKFLTNMDSHPRGIKVQLDSGEDGRVQKKIVQEETIVDEGGFHEETETNETEEVVDEPVKDTPKEENPEVEFKQTFAFDVKEYELREEGNIAGADSRKKNKKKNVEDIKKEVSIAAAAFANSNGGTIKIGFTDDGKISAYFKKDVAIWKNWDAYTNEITNSIQRFTKNNVFSISGVIIKNEPGQEEYLELEIQKSDEFGPPIFIVEGERQDLYVRSKASARSQLITTETEKTRYYRKRFPNWNP
tara:strand:+ start:165 stop:1028 length:864 start_codon:yes stop_codon:yes gene_type:complete